MREKNEIAFSKNNHLTSADMTKNNNWLKRHSSEIIVGLVVCILYTLISNIWASVSTASQNIGINIWTILVDTAYVQASKTTDNTLSQQLFSFFIGGILSMTIIPFMIMIKPQHSTQTQEHAQEHAQAQRNVKRRNLFILSGVLAIFILLYVISGFAYILFPTNIKDKFDIQLEKISPYVKQEEVVLFRSEWRQITSKNDYDNLLKKITVIENKYIPTKK